MNISHKILEAIQATKKVIPGYFESTCAMRIEGSNKGSFFSGIKTPQEIEDLLLKAEWRPYTSDSVMEGCEAFVANIPGKMGVVELEKLPPRSTVCLNDDKGTGFVSAVCHFDKLSFPKVDFTVIILGKEQGETVVFTFHPGAPVRPSTVAVGNGSRPGRKLSVARALQLGLTNCKLS